MPRDPYHPLGAADHVLLENMSKITAPFHNIFSHRNTSVTPSEDVIPVSSEEQQKYGGATTDKAAESDEILNPGELSFDEDTAGGLGRHLGLWSTTFLM